MRRFGRARCRGAAASHAGAQNTRAWDKIKQIGIHMRVQLDEKVSVAARMMVRLEGVAEREPAPCASEHA